MLMNVELLEQSKTMIVVLVSFVVVSVYDAARRIGNGKRRNLFCLTICVQRSNRGEWQY
jgi:hypothetical protein